MTSIIPIIFILGFILIALEQKIRIDKAATALIMGVLCWTVYLLSADNKEIVADQLSRHFGNIAQILFFLMGSMAIVELIDVHDGFDFITRRIKTTDKKKIVWIISILTFLLSSVLNNLTTAIVMISLVRKLLPDRNDRLMLSGLIVIAANAGGAWSPIGDVTTTMLWIDHQVTALNIMRSLFIPSLVCLLVPLLIAQSKFRNIIERPPPEDGPIVVHEKKHVFVTGISMLLLVPVFTALTGMPPFMAILIGLGVTWVVVEITYHGKEEERKEYSAAAALRRIDTPTILFFAGILLAVAALDASQQLSHVATWFDKNLKDQNLIAGTIGLLSSVVDNVPLVAATQGMYSLHQFPTDHYFWEFIAYTTGTGGSILIIGSAAGIAAMGMEKISFFWYLKKIGWLALLGYIAGCVAYILQFRLFG